VDKFARHLERKQAQALRLMRIHRLCYTYAPKASTLFAGYLEMEFKEMKADDVYGNFKSSQNTNKPVQDPDDSEASGDSL